MYKPNFLIYTPRKVQDDTSTVSNSASTNYTEESFGTPEGGLATYDMDADDTYYTKQLILDALARTNLYNLTTTPATTTTTSSAGNYNASWGLKILEQGKTYLGEPYKYGTHNRKTTDCSGFTYQVLRDLGYTLFSPGSMIQWEFAKNNGYNFTDLSQLQVGDLIFFTGTMPKKRRWGLTSHVAIYAGDGKFLGALGGCVKFENLNSSYWKPKILGYARFPEASVWNGTANKTH